MIPRIFLSYKPFRPLSDSCQSSTIKAHIGPFQLHLTLFRYQFQHSMNRGFHTCRWWPCFCIGAESYSAAQVIPAKLKPDQYPYQVRQTGSCGQVMEITSQHKTRTAAKKKARAKQLRLLKYYTANEPGENCPISYRVALAADKF